VLTYTDLPDITLKQIEHFFQHYKDLEPGKWVKSCAGSRGGAPADHEAIERAKK
jgi:inorganic pyrophosphatase